jgi:hypothetical protein
VIYGTIAGVVAYGGYKVVQAINRNTDVYAPDRPLPRDPNPHEHKWKPNQTGGTPNRSVEATPLTGWRGDMNNV